MTLKTDWYKVEDLYTLTDSKVKHNKSPKIKWIKLPCVYKIRVDKNIVHVGRSDTCKKHGGAEKVRKAIVQLLDLTESNPSVLKTKLWEEIRLKYKPNSSNIKIGVIKTNAINKVYSKEYQRTHS